MAAFFMFKTNAVDLSYSGSSLPNNTGASATTSGFSISYSDTAKNICGYRFSIVDSNGLPKSGTKVANVYLGDVSEGKTAHDSGQRFIVSSGVVANKKQLANGTKVSATSSKQSCDYLSGNCGFYSTLAQSPSSIGDWIKNSGNSYQNLQRIYVACGSNLANATESDYVLIEPIFWPKLAGTKTAATATELAIYGAGVSGGDQYKGTDGNLYNAGSTTLWNLCNYINRNFPNALYVSSNTDVYSSVSTISSGTYTYKQIIQNGYGCSVLTVRNVITIKKVYLSYYCSGGTVTSSSYGTNPYGHILYNGGLYFQSLTHGTSSDPYNASTFGLVKAGYQFAGWKVRSTGTVLNQDTSYASTVYAHYDDSSKTTANTNVVYCYLDAVWRPNKVNITYYCNGGNITSPNYSYNAYGHVTYNGALYFHTMNYGESSDPYNASTFGLVKEGYTFSGWKVRSSGKILDQDTGYASTDYAHYDNASKTTANTDGIYCYLDAVWTPNKLYISYHFDYGKITNPDFTTNNYGHISDKSTIYFHTMNYGEYCDPCNASTFGLVRDGYTFAGWQVRSTGTVLNQDTVYASTVYAHYNDSSKTTANMNNVYCYLDAVWEKNTYTNEIAHWAWEFNGNGNNLNKNAFRLGMTTYTKSYGDVYSLNETYTTRIPNGFWLESEYGTDSITGTWTHYPFGTSITQGNKKYVFEYDYKPYNYNISYELNGGTNNSNNPSTYNVLYEKTLSNPTKAGSEFLGWTRRVEKDKLIMVADAWDYHYTRVLNDIEPGTEYKISIDNAKVTTGSASLFSAALYDFTDLTVKDFKNISMGSNIEFTLSCPDTADTTHDICFLIYSGCSGSTNGIGTEFTNIEIDFDVTKINNGCGSAFSSSDELYSELAKRTTGDIKLIANWSDNQQIIIVPIEPNAPYKEATEVMSSFWLVNPNNNEYIPSNGAKVEFSVYNQANKKIAGETQDFVCPSQDKNLAFFKWYVPSGYGNQTVTIKAHIIDGANAYGHVENGFEIEPLNFYRTPNTSYEDRTPEDFRVPNVPESESITAMWWQWKYIGGDFVKKEYAVNNTINDIVITAPNSPSAYTSGDKLYLKSGYGFETTFIDGAVSVTGYEADSNSYATDIQYRYALFPEFNYAYGMNTCRNFNISYDEIGFKYNDDMERQHFIPIYYPDGEYNFKIILSDCWTPAGMITTSKVLTINIDGNAYDDWYIQH